MLTQAALKNLLSYDPEIGTFTWLVKKSKNTIIGERAGHGPDERGYRSLGVDGKVYLEHRLAWLYMTGAWPKDEIDHINGAKHDNKFSNLREATSSINKQNRRHAKRGSKTGILGVRQKGRRFSASIRPPGCRAIHLGTFASAQEAHAAYVESKRKLHSGCTL